MRGGFKDKVPFELRHSAGGAGGGAGGHQAEETAKDQMWEDDCTSKEQKADMTGGLSSKGEGPLT